MSEQPNGHEAIQELAGAAALRALTPDEARFVRAHLAGCPECRRAYAEMLAVADALLRTPEPVAPPPELRQRILDLAARTPQEPAAPSARSGSALAAFGDGTPADVALRADPPSTAERPGAEGEPRPSERMDGFERRAGGAGATPPESASTMPRRRAFNWRDLVLVASLAATLFFGWTTLRLQSDLAGASARLSIAETLADAATRGRVVPVAGSAAAPQIRGAAAAAGGETHLYLEHLPAPPTDRLYQVWLIPPGGQPVGVGVTPAGQGGTQLIQLDRPLAGMDTIAVTQEPAPNGSPGPTTPILASARL